EALRAPNLRDLPILDTDLRPIFKHKLQSVWQASWTQLQDSKLRSVKADVSECHSSFRASRREEVVIARLRVGHTYLTHSYLLCGQVRPDCPMCGEHILLDCPSHRVPRISCGLPDSLAEVLTNDFQAL